LPNIELFSQCIGQAGRLMILIGLLFAEALVDQALAVGVVARDLADIALGPDQIGAAVANIGDNCSATFACGLDPSDHNRCSAAAIVGAAIAKLVQIVGGSLQRLFKLLAWTASALPGQMLANRIDG
jgi:hypothetical protein